MVKCKDEREILRYEGSCSAGRSKPSNNKDICCVCGEEYSIEDLHEVDIRSKTKKICNECAATIHGLM